MLDKIAMIILLILYILTTFVALFIYLVVRGGSENKTDIERYYEDKEQMDYLKNYKSNRRKKINE